MYLQFQKCNNLLKNYNIKKSLLSALESISRVILPLNFIIGHNIQIILYYTLILKLTTPYWNCSTKISYVCNTETTSRVFVMIVTFSHST